MSTIVSQSELQRRALDWISSGLKEGKPLRSLIDEAAMRFNLGPLDVEFLDRFYKENAGKAPDSGC